MWFQQKANVREVINIHMAIWTANDQTMWCEILMKSQSLAAKPPTRNTDYTTREKKLAPQWKQNE